MELIRCYNCMKEFDGDYAICPHCGYNMGEKPKELYHLYPGCVLQGRYVIGVVIGYGGFGVTYKAWDDKLDSVVAIKEYFPTGIVNRVPGQKDVIVYSGNVNKEYSIGLERFLDEAKNMAKFSQHDNVVNAYNFFEENNTAYIVMEFLDGISFKEFLAANQGTVELRYTKEIILAVANALKALHKEGILHRDISPDNVFLLDNGKIKLIDFGASRLSINLDQSYSVMLKPGYAPPEQYRRKGYQGSWTDVYALGAMMYRALTGHVPEESINRQVEDTLIPPKNYAPSLPDNINDAIMRAMALDIEYRYQTVQEFEDAINNKVKVVALEQEIKRRKAKRRNSLIAIIAVLFVVAGVLGKSLLSIRNGSSVKGDLEVWVCADEGEDAQALETYYEQICEEVLCKDYKNITVDVKAFPKAQYESTLLTALASGKEPEVFESTDVSDTVMSHAAGVKELLKNMKAASSSGLNDYYFLSNLSRYDATDKRVPIGFAIPVAYSLRKDAPEHVELAEVEKKSKELDSSGDIEKQIKSLTKGKNDYLLGNTSDYHMLQEQIYGTYEQQKEEIVGKLNMAVIDDSSPAFTTTFSINNKCDKREKEAAQLFIQYLLTYQGQYLLHTKDAQEGIEEANSLSVNVQVDEEYRRQIKSAFSILDDTVEQFKGGE